LKPYIALGLLFLLSACGPQATPFPAVVPTVEVTAPQSGQVAPIRYALAANTQGLVADWSLIQASGIVEQLTDPINPDDLGSRYDIIVAFGDMPQGTRSPNPLHTVLLLNSANPVFMDAALRDVVRRSVDAQAIISALQIEGATAEVLQTDDPQNLRSELANSGWPDGLSLNMAYTYTPGFSTLVEQFRRAGLRVQPMLMTDAEVMDAFARNRIQLALAIWTTPDRHEAWVTRFGSEDVIELYALPISYRALPDLKISFTSDGWPLASR
jgi:hypothetical protein